MDFKINTKIVYLVMTINLVLGFVTLVEGGNLLGYPKELWLIIQGLMLIVNLSAIVQSSRTIEGLWYNPLRIHLGVHAVSREIEQEKALIVIHESMIIVLPVLIAFL